MICTNVMHDAKSCLAADLSYPEYCQPCRLYYLAVRFVLATNNDQPDFDEASAMAAVDSLLDDGKTLLQIVQENIHNL